MIDPLLLLLLQIPSEEEAVFQKLHDDHALWCCRDTDIIRHHILRYAKQNLFSL